IRMAAKHYVGAASRKSGYYARTGVERGATTAARTAADAASTARVAALQGVHRAGRVLSWLV
ncbi:histidinol-phosphatase, partial [Halorubrum sp. CBA1125]|nr:histidinol-phosphatase [Halorubrum sp. CBA1125]